MNKDYVDSVAFIRKSEREDYNNGVDREYDVYIDGDVVWAKFRPNFTYRVRVSSNNFSKYVLDFENSLVYLVPSKINDPLEDITYNNLYINNLGGEVVLDYKSTGRGRINVDDYLAVNVKCNSIVISNCESDCNGNVFVGIIASNMKFIKCDLRCFVKSNCFDDIDSIILENSSILCNITSFVNFNKVILDGSSLIFESNKQINLYSRNIDLNSSLLGFTTNSGSRIAFKYLNMIDSKINSSLSGINLCGVKDAHLENSVIGNSSYNNDITISYVDRDKLSVIYNNVSERDSMSYTGFIERYRGEVRNLYISGKLLEFEYNKIIDDLDKFLVNNKKSDK